MLKIGLALSLLIATCSARIHSWETTVSMQQIIEKNMFLFLALDFRKMRENIYL